jgi:flagellar motor switch protein FliN/FliY
MPEGGDHAEPRAAERTHKLSARELLFPFASAHVQDNCVRERTLDAGPQPSWHRMNVLGVSDNIPTDATVWSRVEQLSCDLSVHIPVRAFGVPDLVRLGQGAVVSAHWELMKEVPLEVSGRQVAWCEFEVMNGRLAVRITELR